MQKTVPINGKIIKIKELTEYGLTVELDNGVIVNLAFNPNYIHMGFSFEKSIECKQEAANVCNIYYKPRLETIS